MIIILTSCLLRKAQAVNSIFHRYLAVSDFLEVSLLLVYENTDITTTGFQSQDYVATKGCGADPAEVQHMKMFSFKRPRPKLQHVFWHFNPPRSLEAR
jgi:hypothetical protein